MKTAYFLVLAVTIIGVSTSTLLSSHCAPAGFNVNSLNGGLAHLGTSSSDHCHCVQTIVRPKIRTHIATVPALHRYLRTKTIPVIERVPYSFTRKANAPSHPLKTGVLPTGLPIGGYNGIGMGAAFPKATSSGSGFSNNGYSNGELNGYHSSVC